MCIDNWALAPVCVSTIGDKKNKLFQEIGTFLFIKVENALLFLNNKNKDFLWKKIHTRTGYFRYSFAIFHILSFYSPPSRVALSN